MEATNCIALNLFKLLAPSKQFILLVWQLRSFYKQKAVVMTNAWLPNLFLEFFFKFTDFVVAAFKGGSK